MHRWRYLIVRSDRPLWETDEKGRDAADVIAISSGSSSPGVIEGLRCENWELVN